MAGLLNTLQTASLSEAEDALRRIREPQDPTTESSNLSGQQLRSTLNKYLIRTSPDVLDGPEIGDKVNMAETEVDITTDDRPRGDYISYRNEPNDNELKSQTQLSASQLLQVVKDSSMLEIPDIQDSERAIHAFFASSAKLFHAFSHDQATQLVHSVYRQEMGDRTGASVSELCSIAAVGCMYSSDEIQDELRDAFYTVAKLYLEESLDADLFRGLKVCTLLAHYNVLDKSTVALSYVGQSSLCTQSPLHVSLTVPGIIQLRFRLSRSLS